MAGRRQLPEVNSAWLPMLSFLGRLRCASFAHLKTLALGGASGYELTQALEWLVENGMVQVVKLPHGRYGYALTARSLRAVPQLREQFKPSVAKVTPSGAVYGWQRAALWAHYTRAGYLIATGLAALRPLHQNRLTALTEFKVGGDPGVVSALTAKIATTYQRAGADDFPALDVAHKGSECVILVADDPYRSVANQLSALPVSVSAYDREAGCAVYLPKIPVVFVPVDEESRWDDAKKDWGCRGPRLRAWLRYTADNRSHDAFPFAKVLENTPPPPSAVVHRRRAPSRTFTDVSPINEAAAAVITGGVC